MYGYCPQWALNWEYRKKGILDEVRHYAADIIALQEVETDQFYKFFLPELKRDGYEGIFSPKSRAKTMSENDRKHVDGCAIFYRTHKFTLIKVVLESNSSLKDTFFDFQEQLVEFNQLAIEHANGHEDMLNRVMTKDNIALAALLQTKEACWDTAGNGLPPDHKVRGGVTSSNSCINCGDRSEYFFNSLFRRLVSTFLCALPTSTGTLNSVM